MAPELRRWPRPAAAPGGAAPLALASTCVKRAPRQLHGLCPSPDGRLLLAFTGGEWTDGAAKEGLDTLEARREDCAVEVWLVDDSP